jgi:hypothetical protein
MLGFWRAFQSLVPVGLLAAAVLGILFVAWRRSGATGRRYAAGAFLATWLLAASAVTLRPQPAMIDAHGRFISRDLQLVPFRELGDIIVHATTWHVFLEQVVGNVVLFLPCGLGLAMWTLDRHAPPWTGLVVGALIGSVIELAQWIAQTGRVSSVDDVIVACVGSGVGFAVGTWLTRRTVPRPESGSPPVRGEQHTKPRTS